MVPSPQPSQGVFVSHSNSDSMFCRAFAARLRDRIEALRSPDAIFYYEDTAHKGDEIEPRIYEAIDSRPVFVVLVSPEAIASRWVRKETAHAIALKRARIDNTDRLIITCKVEECDPFLLHADLREYVFADFVRGDFEREFDSVVAAIRRFLDPLESISDPDIASETPARQIIKEAEQLLTNKRFDDAIVRATLLLNQLQDQLSPADQARVHAVLAKAYAASAAPRSREDWTRVLQSARLSLESKPTQADMYEIMSNAQEQLGEPKEAYASLRYARALVPIGNTEQNMKLLTEQRRIMTGQRTWIEVLRCLDAELALMLDDYERLALRADVLEKLGRDAEALTALRSLTQRSDVQGEAWLDLALLLRKVEHDTSAAEAAFASAIAILPKSDERIKEVRDELDKPDKPDMFPSTLQQLEYTRKTFGKVDVLMPSLCPVKGGDCLIGSDPEVNPSCYKNEQPQHWVRITPFQIAKYPVTVAEYLHFVQAGGSPPDVDNENDIARRFEWNAQLRRPDHPVVCVTWHQATSYAAWLAKVTGMPWRLPTEVEWECAARWESRSTDTHQVGGHARIYPWGDEFDKNACNTNASGIQLTTRVGSYQNGVSPCGALDMAGNVWEWTSSAFMPYPYTTAEESAGGTRERVMRGGSWNFIPNEARCADRDNDVPGHVVFDIGFRLACNLSDHK